MKFDDLNDLEQFIIENRIFADYESIKEIEVGGASYNFCVQTKNKRYFLKLLPDNGRFQKTKALCKMLKILHPTKYENFKQYKMLVMSYFNGRKVYYNDFTPDFTDKLCLQYKEVLKRRLDAQFIAPQFDMKQLCSEIDDLLQKRNGLIIRILYKNFWKALSSDIITLPKTQNVIHGDFTANNLMITKDNAPIILDWEGIRYGYDSEDWCGLCLELSRFRGFFGSSRRLKELCNMINSQFHFSSKEWKYGFQMFYINLLLRRLSNNKKQSWRKQLCLYICLLGYFRVQKAVKNII